LASIWIARGRSPEQYLRHITSDYIAQDLCELAGLG
jgi:hypothetical protein